MSSLVNQGPTPTPQSPFLLTTSKGWLWNTHTISNSNNENGTNSIAIPCFKASYWTNLWYEARGYTKLAVSNHSYVYINPKQEITDPTKTQKTDGQESKITIDKLIVNTHNTFLKTIEEITPSHLEEAIRLRTQLNTPEIELPQEFLSNIPSSDEDSKFNVEKIIIDFFESCKDSKGEIQIKEIRIPEFIKQLIEKSPKSIYTILKNYINSKNKFYDFIEKLKLSQNSPTGCFIQNYLNKSLNIFDDWKILAPLIDNETALHCLATYPELQIPEKLEFSPEELKQALKKYPSLINNPNVITPNWDTLAPHIGNETALHYLARDPNLSFPPGLIFSEEQAKEALSKHPDLINNLSFIKFNWNTLTDLLDKETTLRCLATYPELQIPEKLEIQENDLAKTVERYPGLICNSSVIKGDWLKANQDTVFRLLANNSKLKIPQTLQIEKNNLATTVQNYPGLICNPSVITNEWLNANRDTVFRLLANNSKLKIPEGLQFSPEELKDALKKYPSLINNPNVITPNWDTLALLLNKKTAFHCLAKYPELQIPEKLEIEKNNLATTVQNYPGLICNPSVINNEWLNANQDTVFRLLEKNSKLKVPQGLQFSRDTLIAALKKYPDLINNPSVMKKISQLSPYFSTSECAKTLKIILEKLKNEDSYRIEIQARKNDLNKKYIPIKQLLKKLIFADLQNPKEKAKYSQLIKDCVNKFPQVTSFVESQKMRFETQTLFPFKKGIQFNTEDLEQVQEFSEEEPPSDLNTQSPPPTNTQSPPTTPPKSILKNPLSSKEPISEKNP